MDVQRLPDGTLLVKLPAADWSDVVPQLAGAWTVVAQAVEEYLRSKPDWAWDRLRTYARFESGLLWPSPEPLVLERCANVVGIQIRCLEELYYELPDTDEDPPAFDRAHDLMSRRVAEALKESALRPEARAAVSAMQRLRAHPLTLVEYDDMETEQTILTAAELAGPA